MKIKISIFFICCAIGVSFSQITSRVMINGTISAPLGDDVEGIVIYNKNTGKGTITDPKGNFKISIGVNDRIEVVGVQYQKITVLVDKDIISNRKLHVFLNESINLLEEVVVTPYDITGDVSADIQRITVSTGKIGEISGLTASAINDIDYDWKPDSLSYVKNNAFLEDRMINGLNFVNLFKAIFENKANKNNSKKPVDIDVRIRNMYNDCLLYTSDAADD